VFLICATGLTGEQMRDAAAERPCDTPEQEWETVRAELGKINRVRLARLIEEDTMSTETAASVSTHVLDTGTGRPAAGVPVRLSARSGRTGGWQELGGSATDADGRCRDLPALPEGTTHARLVFDTETYAATARAAARRDAPALPDGESGSPVFFPEVAVAFAVVPGEHCHVPLLLSPFGYSVYRGS
jgi:hydroxyisourate hydrolase